jgi:acyl-CoA synthetase (AMP-forming)/AMP-acid ligase II/NAD(P)-dependent dehydrogenase (short-subunit alcohol dehydrogenase family)
MSKQISIHHLFEKLATQTPEAIAVISEDASATYAELNRSANQAAHYLRTCGVSNGTVVGLAMTCSAELVVCLLGIFKAGGTVVLLDLSHPQKWQEGMLREAHAQLLLSAGKSGDTQLSFGGRTIYLASEAGLIAQQSQENIDTDGGNEVAFFFYTSGSYIVLEHSQLYAQLQWLQKRFALSATDTLLSLFAPTEEGAIVDIFWALTSGASLLPVQREYLQESAYRERILSEYSISVLHTQSSMLDLLSHMVLPATLRLTLASGEQPSSQCVRNFTRVYAGTLSYLYGGRETGYFLEMNPAEQPGEHTIMAVGHTTSLSVYIMNARKQLIPPGGNGEIYVAGSVVAAGYLEHRGESEQRFLIDSDSKTRMFRTGLRGRYKKGGKIEIQGRQMRQVWIGGEQLLLDDVENILLRELAIHSCRILARRNQESEQELVVYVVTIGQATPAIWREQLGAYLPSAWIPKIFMPISHLPLTSNGEVDDQALLALAPIAPEVVARWEEYLRGQEGVERVAVVAREHVQVQTPLHLSDILPEWKGSQSQKEPTQAPIGQQNNLPVPQTSRLSISEGGALHWSSQDLKTLPQVLLRAARQKNGGCLVYVLPDGSEQTRTYEQLLIEARRALAGLRQRGVRAGERVVMQVEWCQEFLPVLWGCLLGGIVPVPVSIAPTYEQPTSTSSRLHHAWQMLERPIVVAGSNLSGSLQALASSQGWEDFCVVSFSDLQVSAPVEMNYNESQPEDLALILLTSGSTGASKGVLLSHHNLLSMVRGMIQHFEFTSESDVTFNWMPLDHVGGVIMLHMRSLYLVSTQIHALPQTILQNPLCWLDYIDRYRASSTWAPNFAFGLINEHAEEIRQRKWDLSSMHYLFNGGEAIAARVAYSFLRLLRPYGLPAAAIHPAWGMSETSSGVIFSQMFFDEGSADVDHLVEVGEPIPGLSLRLVDESQAVVQEGQVGRLQVHGLSVTRGYYQNAEATREAFTPDGWFDTGDLGIMRMGQLTITGRAKDTIIINGINYYSQEIETVVEELPEVETSYTAACAVRDHESTTDQLAIFVVSRVEDTQLIDLLRKIRARVNAQVGITPTYVLPVARESIPKTAIGKIQRTQLKKEFEAGKYQELLKELELLTGNVNTLPSWFYRRYWQRRELEVQRFRVEEGAYLVLVDEEGIGELLCQQLRSEGQRCIRVMSGTSFKRLGDDDYQIEISLEGDYHLLSMTLAAMRIVVKQVVHLWGYDRERRENVQGEHLKKARSRGLLSVLYLVQALEHQWKESGHIKLIVANSRVEIVDGDEELDYEKAPLLGLLKTFDRELPWLQCIHIDMPTAGKEQNACHILYELYNNHEDLEVAYRKGHRFVARLEHIDWSQEAKLALPLQQGGFYLISGGLGGLGYELACHLLQTCQAHLLLIGRTQLTAEQSENGTQSEPHTLVTRLAALQELAQNGGAVHYEAVDVCDLAGLQHAVSQAHRRWERPLDGVFHLAGFFHEQELLQTHPQQIEQVLRPKVEGTWVLHQLLKDRPGSLFVSFSSVNAFFGGGSVGAYAAANCFLESFAHYQRVHAGLRSYSIAWSMWDEIGMSQGYQLKGASQASGYATICPQDGWYSLLTVLQHAPGTVLVGLDGANQYIRRHLVGRAYALQEAIAYLSPGLRHGEQQGWPAEWGKRPDNYRLVQLPMLPLKETGEIDVARLGAVGHAKGQEGNQQPRSELERKILEIWRQVLQNPQVGVLDNFFELGGHSLLATQSVARLQHLLQVEVPVRSLFEHPTVASLTQFIEQRQQVQTVPPLVPISREQPLLLSFAQQRLWFLDQLDPGNPGYAIPVTVEFEGQLDLNAFEESLLQLVERHEVLRTTFQERNGALFQVIAEHGSFNITFIDLQTLTEDQREAAARRLSEQESQFPFNLGIGPLLRCYLMRLSLQRHWIQLDMHHIISDGWSMGVLVHELTSLYQAALQRQPSPLAPLPIQYADYAQWQRQWLHGEVLKEQLRYWTNQLSGAQALELPTDFARQAQSRRRGASYHFELDKEVSEGLMHLSRQEGVTLFMLLLAGFQVLLSRQSGQQDIVVGTDSANRSRLETEGLIGFFVNLLVLRVRLHENPRFLSVLQQLREMVLGAYAHQEVPFEMIVEHLRLKRQGQGTPLVNVLFVMQNLPETQANFPEVIMRPVDRGSIHAKFDLALFLSESSDGLSGSVNYSTDLFREETIARMMSNYEALLRDILAHSESPVGSLEIESAGEKEEGERLNQYDASVRKSKLKKVNRVGIGLE